MRALVDFEQVAAGWQVVDIGHLDRLVDTRLDREARVGAVVGPQIGQRQFAVQLLLCRLHGDLVLRRTIGPRADGRQHTRDRQRVHEWLEPAVHNNVAAHAARALRRAARSRYRHRPRHHPNRSLRGCSKRPVGCGHMFGKQDVLPMSGVPPADRAGLGRQHRTVTGSEAAGKFGLSCRVQRAGGRYVLVSNSLRRAIGRESNIAGGGPARLRIGHDLVEIGITVAVGIRGSRWP